MTNFPISDLEMGGVGGYEFFNIISLLCVLEIHLIITPPLPIHFTFSFGIPYHKGLSRAGLTVVEALGQPVLWRPLTFTTSVQ